MHYEHHDKTLILPRMSIGDHLLLLYFFYIVVYKKDNPGINIHKYPGGKYVSGQLLFYWFFLFWTVVFEEDKCKGKVDACSSICNLKNAL